MPGSDTENQLEVIVAVLGKPTAKYIKKYSAGGRLAEVFAAIPGTETSGSFNKLFKDCDQNAVDLLR